MELTEEKEAGHATFFTRTEGQFSKKQSLKSKDKNFSKCWEIFHKFEACSEAGGQHFNTSAN